MKRLTLSDMILFTMLGALLFVSDIVFELIPNVHGVALLICVITLVYRFKALISIFVYVGINAVLSFILASGMTFWWIPYLYIFPILSLLVMLIPKKLSIKASVSPNACFQSCRRGSVLVGLSIIIAVLQKASPVFFDKMMGIVGKLCFAQAFQT